MKVYELMEKLARIPSGYEVNIEMSIAKEDLKGNVQTDPFRIFLS